MSQAVPSEAPQAARNKRLALVLVGVFCLMVGAAFAAVPLYRMFCQLTGFDGTIRKAEAAPTRVLDQTVNVRFDTNVRNLPWAFTAEQGAQTIKIGQTGMAFFKVVNHGQQAVTGRAMYNVVPEQAGAYFQKLECFCFSDQTIQPGQSIEFPVVYFVDPAYADDFETKGKGDITLSYTFFPSTEAPPEAAPIKTSAQGSGQGSTGAGQQTSTLKPHAAAPPLGGSAAARL